MYTQTLLFVNRQQLTETQAGNAGNPSQSPIAQVMKHFTQHQSSPWVFRQIATHYVPTLYFAYSSTNKVFLNVCVILLTYLQFDLPAVQLQQAVTVVHPNCCCEPQVKSPVVIPQHQRRLSHRAIPDHENPNK